MNATYAISPAISSEVLDLALMVLDNCWSAKAYVPAKRAARLVLELDADNPLALTRLGRIALIERDYPDAAHCFNRVLDAQRSPAAAVNLAIAYSGMKDFAAAIGWCDLALQWEPGFLPAYVHRAAVLEEIGDMAAAERTVLDALGRFPGHAELLYALALYQLHRGDFANGWVNYEQRPPRLELARKLDEYPEWQGESVEGKVILVCGEQGLGDQIMFARYIPLLVELGATVVVFTLPELGRLFASVFPDVRIYTSDAELKGLEPDYWAAMGSLPLRWRRFEAIDFVAMPGAGKMSLPYLWPARADARRFQQLVANDGRPKVGLCWKGNPQHRRDGYRSASFEDFRPLLDIKGVDFYSLQKGDAESGLINVSDYCHDIADTAAAIAALDLVITVDTAMLHLAGAMGVPVWGLIYTPGDWRWGAEDGPSSRWYESAVLFRQAKQREWTAEIATVASAISGLTAQTRAAVGRTPALVEFRGAGECRYGRMIWPRNDHYIGRALDLYGEYSESEAELLRRVLQPGDIVVEAGANIGGLTVALGEIVGSNGLVYAYEPQPLYFEHLEKNTRTRINVTPVWAALGAVDSEISIREVEEQKVHAPGWKPAGSEFGVHLRRVDNLGLPACALIKVDVDGPEHDILIGAEETIDRCRPLIYVEYDKPAEYPEMLGWLHGKSYRLYRHSAPLFNPENFRGNHVNVFGSIVSLMVLAVPMERKDLHPGDWGLERIVVEAQ